MKRRVQQGCLIGCVLLLIATAIRARPVYAPSLAEMSGKADLVVLATPIDQRTLPDRVEMPGVRRGHDPIPALAVETKFEILAVLRGDGDAKTLTLLHYREANPPPKDQPVLNGQALVDFKAKSGRVYLMFLRRDGDGRYSAFNGQTDPAVSIKEVVPATP
jgi:hypothetical protein